MTAPKQLANTFRNGKIKIILEIPALELCMLMTSFLFAETKLNVNLRQYLRQ